ncbi:MAG: ATP-binding cassette domain-containing protein, partial [Candidatus Peribacteraceae bacterium]|nr:ATP-binding cassette domain-containing protein [Candidatus Peribacteraceae bacterium]
MNLLSIRGLHVSVAGKEIVRGVSLGIRESEVHAIMGPNGAGKSTLVHALMGHPGYEITKGTVTFRGKNLLKMEPHERARAGLFLAFQYPREIAGVSVGSFLFAAYNAQMAVRNPSLRKISPIKFQALLAERMKLLGLDPSFADRSLNHGFSGGEKKKAEMLQLHMLLPLL